MRAFLYTWGGRKTAEGEKIPVRIEELDLGYIDGMLLLPLVVEHTIDERSPIYGHTYDSLTVSNIDLQLDHIPCHLHEMRPFKAVAVAKCYSNSQRLTVYSHLDTCASVLLAVCEQACCLLDSLSRHLSALLQYHKFAATASQLRAAVQKVFIQSHNSTSKWSEFDHLVCIC